MVSIRRRKLLGASLTVGGGLALGGCGGGAAALSGNESASSAGGSPVAPGPTPITSAPTPTPAPGVTTAPSPSSNPGSAPAPAPTPTPTPAPAPAPAPLPPPGTTLTTLRLSSSQPGVLPFAVGHAFRKGDIPSNTRVAAQGTGLSAFEADVRNRWPDGSVKFAVLSGMVTVNGAVDLQLSASTSAAGSTQAVTLDDLRSTGVTAAISMGGATANWTSSDWAAPHAVIQVGSTMSSWTYRKPLGADAHLVAWLEVRCYANGQVEALPWIENGYLAVAASTSKSGRLSFSLNGTVRYDSAQDSDYTSAYSVGVVQGGSVTLAAQSRAALVSGSTLSHWSGTASSIVPRHERAYLEATRVVPAYRPDSINESKLAALTKTYSPMRTSYLNEGMGATGFEEGIGMLPAQSAMYIVSGDARAYRAVVASGFSLGSYSIHYRDSSTNRPLLFSSHPQKSTNTGSDLVPSPSGSAPYRYAQSHHPAAAYLPYLLTGWNWFVEEIQFQTTLHYLASPPGSRQGSNYFLQSSAGHYGGNNQGGPRAVAWQWRTLAMTASITPDGDLLRSQFLAALAYNSEAYRAIHETGTWGGGLAWAKNSLGIVFEPGFPSTSNGRVLGAPWQDDFVTMSVGFTWDLDVLTQPAAVEALRWFRDFKYRAVVGRLGQQNLTTVWNFRDAAPYNMYLGTPSGSTQMNWYPDWGAAYADNFSFAQTAAATNSGQTGNDLRGGNIGGVGLSTSYWGNLQPAIAYAVDHGAAGAREAYDRMTGSSNFATKAQEFKDVPIWGVKPRTV
jgi:hypothetical protein